MKFLLVGLCLVSLTRAQIDTSGYPDHFIWGTATASYQIEGAAFEGGRGPSVWDTFSRIPGNVYNLDNGDVADDFYHRYEEDIQLMVKLGVEAFRFSISWSRLIPSGLAGSEVNQEGVDFYNRVINELIANDIIPQVTLYHWDLPNNLQLTYGGWLNRERIIEDYLYFARLVFAEYGDRVKDWITFNEPGVFIGLGYGGGGHAPGLNTPEARFDIPATLVLCHALTVQMWRQDFFPIQGGVIGITVDAAWAEPYTQDQENIDAAERQLLATLAIYTDPLYFGDYGDDMKAFWGERLEVFTPEQQELLRGTSEFFGLNHYSSRFVQNDPDCSGDTCTIVGNYDQWGVRIGGQSASDFLIVVPWGFRKLLNWIDQRYDRPPIYVTENGYSDAEVSREPVNGILPPVVDTGRSLQAIGYLEALREAVAVDGVDVRGYYHWSFMDNFEWAEGYSRRFGLVYVDIRGNLDRIPKDSFYFYGEYIAAARAQAKKAAESSSD